LHLIYGGFGLIASPAEEAFIFGLRMKVSSAGFLVGENRIEKKPRAYLRRLQRRWLQGVLIHWCGRRPDRGRDHQGLVPHARSAATEVGGVRMRELATSYHHGGHDRGRGVGSEYACPDRDQSNRRSAHHPVTYPQ